MSVIPQRTIFRRPPENLRLENEDLFRHEYERNIPPVYAHQFDSVMVSGPLPISLSHPYALLKLSHPWEKRFEAIARALPEAVTGLLRAQEEFSNGLWVTDQWSRNYFHWITDSLPRLLLADTHGFVAPAVIPHFFARSSHIRESLDYLGREWIPLESNTAYRLRSLYIFSPLAPTGSPHPDTISGLRESFGVAREETTESFAQSGEKLWVSRQKSRRRRITNEEQLETILRHHDFRIVYPEDLGFQEQVELFKRARVVAGLHGAGLTNMVFMAPGATVLEVRRFADAHNNSYFSLANSSGHRYRYLLAEPGRAARFDDDCLVDPDSLEKELAEL